MEEDDPLVGPWGDRDPSAVAEANRGDRSAAVLVLSEESAADLPGRVEAPVRSGEVVLLQAPLATREPLRQPSPVAALLSNREEDHLGGPTVDQASTHTVGITTITTSLFDITVEVMAAIGSTQLGITICHSTLLSSIAPQSW